jgi:hypothetical protein
MQWQEKSSPPCKVGQNPRAERVLICIVFCLLQANPHKAPYVSHKDQANRRPIQVSRENSMPAESRSIDFIKLKKEEKK